MIFKCPGHGIQEKTKGIVLYLSVGCDPKLAPLTAKGCHWDQLVKSEWDFRTGWQLMNQF